LDEEDDEEPGESQPLLSPAPLNDVLIPADHDRVVESQLTIDGILGGESTSDGLGGDPTIDGDDELSGGGDALADYFSRDDVAEAEAGGAVYDITDYTANEYDIHERISHFMGRIPISNQNRVAVEAAYMIEAVTLVKSMRSMRKAEIAQKVQDKYKSYLSAIPLNRFADASVKIKMAEKYYRAKTNSAEGFLTKATDVLKNVRSLAAGIRGIGTPLHQIPSGKSLMDMKNEFILKKYHEDKGFVYSPSNNDEELMMEVPEGWWLLYPSTNLLLAALVHRSNPDIIADPTEIAPGPTRASLRADGRNDTAARRDRDRIVENYGTERQRAEDSMLSSKAHLMAQTIDSGTIDQVKEQLTLLAQFKDSFISVQNRIHEGQGQADFDQTAHDLLSELPFLKKRRLGGEGNN
jgi:hypothetical protein